MRIVSSPGTMQRIALQWRRDGRRIAFVPTMGYLHAGHISLVQRARREAGKSGIVLVSIYVNPTQFGPSEDLSRYPRDLRRDRRLCAEAGVDVIFRPSDATMYPGRERGLYSTYVVEEQLSRDLEATTRPGHFRGVATVVTKLFNLVLPDVAVFGAKDYQQAAVVRRIVEDLNMPVRIVVSPTKREEDGLAMSSRNKYLTAQQRPQARALWQGIRLARQVARFHTQHRRPAILAKKLKGLVRWQIEKQPDARVDYIEFFDPDSLVPVPRVRPGVHMALAVYVGRTRLIDNGRI
jgi:pantoate--beta-alanine ligase